MKRVLGGLVILLLVIPSTASASHRSNSYCSSSGDICQATNKVNGVRKLRISIAAKYFNRYKLCVTAPDGSRDCDTFNIHKQGSAYGDSVRWNRHFPNGGSGAYSVKWKGTSGGRYGRILGFHR